MNKITPALLLFFFTISLDVFSQDETKYLIQPNKSMVMWNAKKVTGEHNGVINIKNGYVLMNEEKLAGGVVFIDMKSIVDLDIEDAEDKKKLENHLKSEDFFNAHKFPEAVFKIYKIIPLNDEGSPYNYMVSGGLTIKGFTNQISFPMKVEMKDGKVFLNGLTDVDRTQYDIKYGSGKFFEDLGDSMIYDNFTIEFKVAAKLPEDQ